MLSKKMTFSLMSLITLLAFAFAFVADDAFAAEKPFEIKIVGAQRRLMFLMILQLMRMSQR